jgi:hypothetical protein
MEGEAHDVIDAGLAKDAGTPFGAGGSESAGV